MTYFTVAAIGVASWFYPPSMYAANAHVCAMNVVRSSTRVEIINDDNRRSSWCTVIGAGPFVSGRIIDVSPAVRDDLGMRDSGLANVRVYLAHRSKT